MICSIKQSPIILKSPKYTPQKPIPSFGKLCFRTGGCSYLCFWRALFKALALPLALVAGALIGHVATTVSRSKVAVSFTHINKSNEPAFSVLFSRFLLGESFPPSVYLSLVPIIGGCALSALLFCFFRAVLKH